MLNQFVYEMWNVLTQMSPWLLFGFVMAGVLSVLIAPAWVERHLGNRGFTQIFKAALFGIPMPLCSCSVIPVTAGLRRAGAGKGAVVSFLTATPQTGVDSIAVTYSLLGPVFTVFRVLAALLSGLFCGSAVELIDRTPLPQREAEAAGCCAAGGESAEPWWRRIFHYGLIRLPRDIGRSLLVGILISALMAALIPDNWFADKLSPGLGMMLVMLLLGLPVYVCSTASIPVAITLMQLGVTPGAALVFLIAGPATNAATLTTVWKLLGRRTVAIYLGAITVCALLFGALLDALPLSAQISEELHRHAESAGWLGTGSALLLLILLVPAVRPRWRKVEGS